MEKTIFGRTGLTVTIVGFGAWAIGGDKNAVGNWGPVEDDESIESIHRALDLGVNWIDTAPGYGCGHSEEVVGRAIKGLEEPPLIFTKCGFVWDDDGVVSVDITPEVLRRDVDQSLYRLGVDCIDLYQIHWVEPENDPEVESAWQTLAEMKAAGKVRHIGVSNFNVDQLRRCEHIAPVETLQPPYSLVERGIEAEILPYCDSLDIGVVVYSPMQSGLLSGRVTRERIEGLPENDARRFDPNFEEPLLTRNLDVVEQLRSKGEALEMLPGQLAIAWTIANPAVDCAIVGFRRAEQVQELFGRPPLRIDGAAAAELAALTDNR